MKRLYIFITLALCLLGCEKKIYHWDFEHEISDICVIKIVTFDNEILFNDDPKKYEDFKYHEIKIIDINLEEEFYYDITSLEMTKVYRVNPWCPYYNNCFLVVYTDGEYDVICQKGSHKFKYNENLRFSTYFINDDFDDNFNKVLEKYM